MNRFADLRTRELLDAGRIGASVMKILAACLLLLLALDALAVDAQYQLDAGDVITIRVFGEEDLTFDQLQLTNAGTFSFPFLGEIRAGGKTAAELEAIIVEGLKGDYLIDPKVSISILEYRQFFVNGEVKSPGGYRFQPGLTLRSAVALAGGFTERASKTKITIIHEGDLERVPVRASLDSPVKPGDIITIEQSFF